MKLQIELAYERES